MCQALGASVAGEANPFVAISVSPAERRPDMNELPTFKRAGLGPDGASGAGMFAALAAESRDSLQMIDSTIVKAHRAAAGAKGGSASGDRHQPRWALDGKSMRSLTARAGRFTSS
jgi:hypothetical protein